MNLLSRLPLVLLVASCGAGALPTATDSSPPSTVASVVEEIALEETTLDEPVDQATMSEDMVIATGQGPVVTGPDDPSLEGISGSILELLGPEVRSDLDVFETQLVSLLVDPRDLNTDLQIAYVSAADLYRGAKVGDGWFQPTPTFDLCGSRLEEPPIPSISGAYVVGDATIGIDSLSSDETYALLDESEFGLSIYIQVLDNREQRDSLALALWDLYSELDYSECERYQYPDGERPDGTETGPERTAIPIPAPETGYPSMAFDVYGFSPNRTYFYSVGERLVVRVSLSVPVRFAGGEGTIHLDDVDSDLIDDLIVTQIEHLVSVGLG